MKSKKKLPLLPNTVFISKSEPGTQDEWFRVETAAQNHPTEEEPDVIVGEYRLTRTLRARRTVEIHVQ